LASTERRPRSPLYFGPVSNGEFVPRPASDEDRRAEQMVQELAAVEAPRHGLSRRAFLRGPAGMAAALYVVNQLTGCRSYGVDRKTVADPDAARAVVGGNEFVLDCQTHHVDAQLGAAWIRNNAGYYQTFSEVSAQQACGRDGALACLARETYLHEVFVASDTTVAMLSGVPAKIDANPLANDEIAATRAIVNHAAGSQRLLAQGVVYPNDRAHGLDALESLSGELAVAGWKVYTPFDPTGGKRGFWLDDQEHGLPFLERVAKSAAKVVFVHKGLPWPIWDSSWASPRDIGPAARQAPGVSIVCYHSGYDPQVAEGPYDPAGKGVDRLIKSCADAGIGKGGNVYAELGGTWFVLMRKPDEAAHVLGKLLRHFGEDRILWGTDALFLGPPQQQLAAFRAFQIPAQLQEKHGYPELTPAIKAKILGLNAARLLGVDLAAKRFSVGDSDFERELRRRKEHAAEQPLDLPPVYGPRTRRELFALFARRGGRP
jgi:predicted TIM-barrel fold metal-dependent hydrolase